ncbi:MAG: hypothetical protein KDB53_12985 [Planctomycetes bacterium]|nr:hypothetical protein [Planctomycetota bacterium]
MAVLLDSRCSGSNPSAIWRSSLLADVEPAGRLIAVLAELADRQAECRHFVHYWLSETLRAELPALGAECPEAVELAGFAQDHVTLGINLRGRTEVQFRAAYRAEGEGGRDGSKTTAFRTALGAALAAAAYGGPDLLRSLRVLLAGPPDSDDGAWLLAELACRMQDLDRLKDIVERSKACPSEGSNS